MEVRMQELNESLFLLLDASYPPSTFVVLIAKFFAEYTILLVPLALLAGWLRGNNNQRKLMLEAATAGLLGLLLAQIMGLVWQHPRPFMIGLGQTLIPHAADSSFPSDHLTLLWAVDFSFLMHQKLRAAGIVLALLGIPMAWARIYLGVHFPLDMIGAAMVAGLSAWLCFREARWFAGPIFGYAIRSIVVYLRRLFAGAGYVSDVLCHT